MLTEIKDQAVWDQFVNQHEFGHPLQLWGWGELKRLNNWEPIRLALIEGDKLVAGAQMLLWTIPKLGGKVAYLPRGPVARPSSKEALVIQDELIKQARAHGAIFLKIEPAWLTADLPSGWKISSQPTLLAETYTIDLTKAEADIESGMRPKTRQYIRKAQTAGVDVVRNDSEDIKDFWRIYSDTATRAKFGLHEQSYYQAVQSLFGSSSYLFEAKIGGNSQAFVWLVGGGEVAFELYGGMTATGAGAKANYALKAHSIEEMKRLGYRVYDFNGRLHEGVSQFKAGFGPDETDYIGSYDWPINKLKYQLWTKLFPIVKPLGRKLLRGKA